MLNDEFRIKNFFIYICREYKLVLKLVSFFKEKTLTLFYNSLRIFQFYQSY